MNNIYNLNDQELNNANLLKDSITAMLDIIDNLDQIKQIHNLVEGCAYHSFKPRTICININKQINMIAIKDIVFVEKVLRKVVVHTSNNGTYEYNGNIKDIELELGQGFLKINQGIIVRKKAIKAVKANDITLYNGVCCRIGKTYVKTVREYVNKLQMEHRTKREESCNG